jgi:hypothetical protein
MVVRIENRSQLVYLLSQAAELEHAILCCYLFTAFSMKKDASEALPPEHIETVRRWHQDINAIAVEEMIHFATACNLLTAIGGRAHVVRTNLPTSTHAYPEAFALQLLPFGLPALEHYINLERPEPPPKTPSWADVASSRFDRLGDIFSSERTFDTVGELYRGIQDGFSYLADKLGEERLFVGHPGAQAHAATFQMPGLILVKDLESALAAINLIVEQGEGASEDSEHAHYHRFVHIRDEYAAILSRDPSFDPARPVVTNPYTIAERRDPEVLRISNRVEDAVSVDLCNLIDGSYELMVQCLGLVFEDYSALPGADAQIADVAVGLMLDVIRPLSNALTRLPAGPSHPGKNAGPSFRLSPRIGVPGEQSIAWQVLRERAQELVYYCRFLEATAGVPPEVASARGALEGYVAGFAKALG